METEISELIPIYTLTKLMLASVKVGEVGPYVHILAVVIYFRRFLTMTRFAFIIRIKLVSPQQLQTDEHNAKFQLKSSLMNSKTKFLLMEKQFLNSMFRM